MSTFYAVGDRKLVCVSSKLSPTLQWGDELRIGDYRKKETRKAERSPTLPSLFEN